MTDRNESLIALAERCEKATGPDRELDAEIARAIGWTNVSPVGHGHVGHCPNHFFGSVPLHTASLDAAMTLVPEGEQWNVASYPWAEHTHKAAAWVGNKRGPVIGAATPALALCAAALRARAAQ
jgi:hypothetical protein